MRQLEPVTCLEEHSRQKQQHVQNLEWEGATQCEGWLVRWRAGGRRPQDGDGGGETGRAGLGCARSPSAEHKLSFRGDLGASEDVEAGCVVEIYLFIFD